MTGNHQLDSLIAAFIIGGSFAALWAGGIFIYRIFHHLKTDFGYAKISKKTKSQGKVVAHTGYNSKDTSKA